MRQRRKAREVAVKVLYELDILNVDIEEAVELFWNNFEAHKGAKEFSSLLIEGAWKNRDHIDNLISSCSENWSIARMSRVDRSILRMAAYELLYCKDIPPRVTLNEAIDIAKLYGSENSGAFINGILDALYVKSCRDDPNQDMSLLQPPTVK